MKPNQTKPNQANQTITNRTPLSLLVDNHSKKGWYMFKANILIQWVIGCYRCSLIVVDRSDVLMDCLNAKKIIVIWQAWTKLLIVSVPDFHDLFIIYHYMKYFHVFRSNILIDSVSDCNNCSLIIAIQQVHTCSDQSYWLIDQSISIDVYSLSFCNRAYVFRSNISIDWWMTFTGFRKS